MLLAGPALAAFAVAEPSTVTVWTDRQQYWPGDKGTLYVAYYNSQSHPVAIANITVNYASWNAYIGGSWVGNQTIQYTGSNSVTVSGPGSRTFSDIQFTVPSDGRAGSTSVTVTVGTDHGYDNGFGSINVQQTSRYLDQIVSLMTILAVLVIVSAIIIAAAVFLSARRPQMMWRSEQKE